MRTLSIVLLAVGAACGGAAVALASVGLTLAPGNPAVPELNAAALSLALAGALAGILSAPVRRRADRAESRGNGCE